MAGPRDPSGNQASQGRGEGEPRGVAQLADRNDLTVLSGRRESDRSLDEDAAAGPLRRPEERPWRPDRAREYTRILLAAGLLAVAGAVVVAAWWAFALTGRPVGEITDLLQDTLTPVIGLAGAATGYYFGRHS